MQNSVQFATEKTWWQRIFDSIGIAAVALAVAYTLLHWTQLPNTVPLHFNAIGHVDRYGSRYALFLVPTLAAALYGLFHFLEKTPQTQQYRFINEEIAPELDKVSSLMMHIIKNTTMLLLSYATISLVESALDGTSSLNMWVFGFLLGFVLLPSVIGGIYVYVLQMKTS